MNPGVRATLCWGLLGLCCLLICGCGALTVASSDGEARDTQSPPLVLTSVGPIYQITKALLADTQIEVANLPEQPRSLSGQPTWFKRQLENISPQLTQAQVVVTMSGIWDADPLYVAARQFNIGVIQIDASSPYSNALSGVSRAMAPVSGELSPYFWLSSANVIRSANTIAADLVRVFPEEAPLIDANRAQFNASISQLSTEYAQKFLEVIDLRVFALTEDFVYLTSELGLFVDGYNTLQDIRYADSDIQMLHATIADNQIPVVIHKWQPSDPIQSAVQQAGARLVVLDNGETTQASMPALLRANLEALYQGFVH